MTDGRIIVVSAPSGSGKGTVIRELISMRPGVVPSVSYTSRTPREGELDNVHYYFVTKDCFREMIDKGEFVEWDFYQGDYYGTSINKIDRLLELGADVVFDITIKGAYAIKDYFPQIAALVFLLPPSFAELENRLRKRGTETDEKIAGRLAEARREIISLVNFDYYIINNTVKDAAEKLDAIITAEKLRVCKDGANAAGTLINDILEAKA